MHLPREKCAEQLIQLAMDERYAGRQEDLRSLAAAVRDQGDGSWTGVDLVGAFPAEASIHVREKQRLESAFGIMAGVSVFLPVAWTWWGLRDAAAAYRDLLAEGGENGRTFLAMWTSGFDGRLAEFHRLVPLASWAILLILFAMACIVGHRVIADRNIGREEASAREARAHLVGALGAAQRYLNVRRLDDPKYLEAAIKSSVKQLAEAHEAARAGVQELRAATKESVDSLGVATTRAVTQLNSVAQKIVDDLKPLLDATTAAGTSMARTADAAVQAEIQIGKATSEMNQSLQAAMQSFSTNVQQSNRDLSQTTQQGVGNLSASVRELTDSLGKVATVKDEWKKALVEGLDANRASVTGVDERTAQFSAVLRDHEATLQVQANELTRAADLAQQVLHELHERENAAGGVA